MQLTLTNALDSLSGKISSSIEGKDYKHSEKRNLEYSMIENSERLCTKSTTLEIYLMWFFNYCK